MDAVGIQRAAAAAHNPDKFSFVFGGVHNDWGIRDFYRHHALGNT
jgi:hypothetical protein